MFPIDYLRSSVNKIVIIAVKSGEFYNGYLESCDNFMNLHMTNVKIQTNQDDDIFVEHAMIRGHNVKYVALPNDVADIVKDRRRTPRPVGGARGGRGGNRGGYNARGRGGYNSRGGRGGNRGGYAQRPQKYNNSH